MQSEEYPSAPWRKWSAGAGCESALSAHLPLVAEGGPSASRATHPHGARSAEQTVAPLPPPVEAAWQGCQTAPP
eukprot:4190763-Alexandrium_andersonii.AAC.1